MSDTASPVDPSPTGRRRGERLVRAIHAATLAELARTGYARLAIEAVADRAGTGKAALYRRWPTKRELVIDALNSALPDLSGPIDQAGGLRESLLTCLRGMRDVLAGRTRFPEVTVLVELLRDPEVSRDYREKLINARVGIVRSVFESAAERGELSAAKITPLIVRTGPALVLQSVLMTGQPPTDADLEDIADQIVLPLLMPTCQK